MASMCSFSAFYRDESGAASVDWVVLAAACVALGLGVTNVVATEMTNLTQEVRAELQRDMTRNPFDLEHSSLGTDGCTHFYLDPAADPAAADNPNRATGCEIDVDGTSSSSRSRGNNGWGNGDQDAPGNSGPNNNAENSTTYTVMITSDDHDDD